MGMALVRTFQESPTLLAFHIIFSNAHNPRVCRDVFLPMTRYPVLINQTIVIPLPSLAYQRYPFSWLLKKTPTLRPVQCPSPCLLPHNTPLPMPSG